MKDATICLARTCDKQPIYRRTIQRADGREVLLYGGAPNTDAAIDDYLDVVPGTSELRWHPLRREWSVYATGRQNRTFKPSKANDPLAPATADGATTEVPVPDFEVAVIENRFPSFSAQPQTPDYEPDGVERVEAVGRCEVVVYTSAPVGNLSTLTLDRRKLLVHVWIDRYRALFEGGAAYVLPFENRGEEVGVTLFHPHGQVYAFPVVPKAQAEAAASFAEGYDLAVHMRTWWDVYGIEEAGDVLALAPPFARFPYEIWLAPRHRRAGPWEMSDVEIAGFAELLGEITRRYDVFFGRECPYMLSLHAAPALNDESWHFTAQFYPLLRAPDKLKYLASVEQATGLFTVDIAPEDTAKAFRRL